MPVIPFVPTDPRFEKQWHLQMLGDLATVWGSYTGAGVTVGVYDDGVDLAHPDLDDVLDLDLVPRFEGAALPFDAVRRFDTHGTSVAGVIAAEANGAGVVGVAFGATLGGVNVIGAGAARGSDAWRAAFNQMDLFDITNHSWGNDDQFTLGDVTSTYTLRAFERTAEDGRDGLGTIHVKAVANGLQHAQAEDVQTTRHMILVSALNDEGVVSSYAARGANLMVLAPTDDGFDNRTISTTDRVGTPGDNRGNYTDIFGGTSSATPTVSGVVALMLEANPDLGWRDVQEILANSARHTGADPGNAPEDHALFSAQFNGAQTWNGGGHHISEDYGFGALDAYAAVRMAEVWSFIGPAGTSLNEVIERGPALQGMDRALLGKDQMLEIPLTVRGLPDFRAEHVTVDLGLTHARMRDLQIDVVSPAGTVINLMTPALSREAPGPFNRAGAQGIDWPIGITLLRGEAITGDWTLQVTDTLKGKTGVIDDFGLTFYGREKTDDDVYTYTDEITWALGLDPDRLTLSDGAGEDAFNMAAMTGDLMVDLSSGAQRDGTAFVQLEAGTQMTHVVTGDGDDTLLGTGEANSLIGMRGTDLLRGKGGGDRLLGGAEADTLQGGAGADTLRGGPGADRIVDGAGRDLLIGGGGRDIFVLRQDGARDMIRDFTLGEDEILLAAFDIGAARFTDLAPGRVAIDHGEDRLIVEDGAAGVLTAADLAADLM